MLTEVSAVPAEALPIAALRDHVRLGTGFADDALQDGVLEAALRAALGTVETHTALALIRRTFALRLGRWRDAARHPLPLAPVDWIVALEITRPDGTVEDAADTVVLTLDQAGRAAVEAGRGALPCIPQGGVADLRVEAGFGPWEAVPAALRQAVLMLAGFYYEDRGAAGEVALPAGVAGLLAPWRPIRLGGGR